MMEAKDWRPARLDEFIGQAALVKELRIEIAAARSQRRQLRSMIFSEPQGCGKSSLLNILAHERGSPPPVTVMGKTLTHLQLSTALLGFDADGYDEQGFLINPEVARFPIFCIDEAQEASPALLELLHPVLEPGADGRYVFQAREARGDIAPCWCVAVTVVLCTNFLGALLERSPATVSRFPIRRQMEWYTADELAMVIRQFARQNRVSVAEEAVRLLASRSNGMPRQAINMFKRATDFASVRGSGSGSGLGDSIRIDDVQNMMDTLGIDQNGLDLPMRNYLDALAAQPNGRMSLQALEGVLGVDRSTLLYAIEPVLMRRQFISRCSAGREITPAGRAALSRESDRFTARQVGPRLRTA